jgi:ribonuclease BN (tRNA processing enzyme)
MFWNAFELVEYPEDEPFTTAAELTVTATEVPHYTVRTFAFRVTDGSKTLAYSGDSAPSDTLAEVARDADLFVCEAYVFDRRVRYHLDYRTLAENRPRLGCRRLVLTHMSGDMLGRLPLPGVECAEDGLELTV